MTKRPEPVTLFYSYAHKDESLREQLEIHLSLLRRQGLISEWHDRTILSGAVWAQEIDEHLEKASIILLLISPDFLASDYCYSVEMQRALERHDQGLACVVPLLLRPVDWQGAPFAHLQMLPRDAIPVTRWTDQDEAFAEIAAGIRRIIEAYPEAPVAPPRSLLRPESTSFTRTHTPLSKASFAGQKNRERLIRRVRNFWIKGVFEQSLHNVALMTLGLQESPEAVANPWRLVLQESGHVSPPLPAGTRITEVYDDADGELLILGEPGAGKTTLLLEVARDLLDRAEQELAHPIPVVFNLSSWVQKRQPLASWLIEELETKYQVPRMVGSDWVNADQILPLLDGLDEVDVTSRTACMQVINEYHQTHSLVPLVVCCRVNEYLSQANRLALDRAVTIQSLTTEQINQYFASIGEQTASLRVALQNDPVLQELATTPLMLNVLIMAYQGSSLEEIEGDVSTEVRQQQIFAAYVQRMFRHRRIETHYTSEQTKGWLTWLAKQMKQRNQTQFYIERLQIDWLPKSRQGQLYTSVVCGLLCLFLVPCVEGIMGGSFLDWLRIGLLNAIVFILLNGVLFVWLTERDVHVVPTLSRMERGSPVFSREEKRSKGSSRLALLFTQFLLSRVGYGFLSGLFDGILVGFLMNPIFGLVNGLFYGSFFALVGRLDTKIQPTEILVWSWTSVRRNVRKSLINGLCIGFLFELFSDFQHLFSLSIFFSSLFFGLTAGLVLALLFMLIGGFSRNMLDTQKTMKPNQGIWNSFYNSTRLTLLFGPAFGLVVSLLYSLVFNGFFKIGYIASLRSDGALIYGVTDGLTIASLIWLINGGLACIQHLVLRVLLWQTGCAPWHYPRFLDYASERILLLKVGGGYIFVHRLLLEYFASLELPLSAT